MKQLTPNLKVDHVQDTMNWYQKTLGFESLMTLPDEAPFVFAIIKREAVTIMLQQSDSFTGALASMASQPCGGTLTLYIDVQDIASEYERAQAAQADIVAGLEDTFYNTREFTLRDNNGYYITLAQDL
jgi:uncharacterized glyoxalase superfamily protein PhnB